MPVLNSEVDHAGRPIIELYVAMGTTEAEVRREAGLPTPGTLLVAALVDTGASRSQINLSLLEQLGLSPVGEVAMHSASTGEVPEVRELYVVNLALAGDRPGPLAEDLEVIGASRLDGLKVQMLLGRDVLSHCLLAFDGPNRRFSMAYDPPSPGPEG